MNETTNPLLGIGIYSLSEAARLARVPRAKAARWSRGYQFKADAIPHNYAAIWHVQHEPINNEFALGFLDLIELRFVDAFRKAGVSLQSIRRAAERAFELFKVDHPFCHHRFKTDGRTIFVQVNEEVGDDALLDIVKNQYAFEKVLRPYLHGLEFEADTLMRWWPLGKSKGIVLDPNRSLGKPIAARSGVPTQILANAYRVEESFGKVAKWYDVDPKDVRSAVEFEQSVREPIAA